MRIDKDKIISAILFATGLYYLTREAEEYITGMKGVKRFYHTFKDAFFKVAKKYGYDPLILFAHAYYESRKGNWISGLAERYYNFFGLKGNNYWIKRGRVVYLKTKECLKTEKPKDTPFFKDTVLIGYEKCGCKNSYCFSGFAPFRVYRSVEEALEDYISLIRKLYPEAYKNRGLAPKYFEGLFHGLNGRRFSTRKKSVYINAVMNYYKKFFKLLNEEVSGDVQTS